MTYIENFKSLLRAAILPVSMLALLTNCSEQNFSGGSNVAAAKPKKPIPPGSTTGSTTGPTTGSTDGPLSTDDGGLAGTPVSMVGIGFEDIGGAGTDHNDAYLCFNGSFNVDSTTHEIVSNKDQTNVIAAWGNLAAIPHVINITITDSSGKETYNQNFQGIKYAPLIKLIPLNFTRGAKLSVTMDGRVKHTSVGPGAYSSEVKLDTCNNSGR